MERGPNSTTPRRTIPSTPSSSRRKQQNHVGGRGHVSSRFRRTIPSPSTSKRENATVFREREGAQQYQTAYDHTLYNLVKAGENSRITRAGGGTTVPNPIRSYPLPFLQTGENSSITWAGGGTTVPDLVGPFPPLERPNGRMLPCSERGRGHKSTRPRRILPSITLSKRGKTAGSRGRGGAQQYPTS